MGNYYRALQQSHTLGAALGQLCRGMSGFGMGVLPSKSDPTSFASIRESATWVCPPAPGILDTLKGRPVFTRAKWETELTTVEFTLPTPMLAAFLDACDADDGAYGILAVCAGGGTPSGSVLVPFCVTATAYLPGGVSSISIIVTPEYAVIE